MNRPNDPKGTDMDWDSMTNAQQLRWIGETFKAAYFSDDETPAQTDQEYREGLEARARRAAERAARKAAR